MVGEGESYRHTSATAATIKTGSGWLLRVVLETSVKGTELALLDDTTTLVSFPTSYSAGPCELGIRYRTSLKLTTSSTSDRIVIVYD